MEAGGFCNPDHAAKVSKRSCSRLSLPAFFCRLTFHPHPIILTICLHEDFPAQTPMQTTLSTIDLLEAF